MYRLLGGIPVDVCGLPHDGRVDPLRRRGHHPLCVFFYFDFPYPAFHRCHPLCVDYVCPWPVGRLYTAPEVGPIYISSLAIRCGFGRGCVPDDFTLLRLNPYLCSYGTYLDISGRSATDGGR